MNNVITRRCFLKTTGVLAAPAAMVGLGSRRLGAAETARAATGAQKLGWRLACQTYTFNRFTFYEAIDKIASLGLRYVEAYSSQPISRDRPETRTNASMPVEVRKELKMRLANAGLKLISYYSINLSSHRQQSRQEFEFAKDMGIEILVSEPLPSALDTVEKLCEEYQISVALHNHSIPSPYWNPDSVLNSCKARSKRIGICGDSGYWIRWGMNPVDMIEKLGERVISFYLKDMNEYGQKVAHDVPWGTGKGEVKAMLEEVHRQGITPLFVIEYGYNWMNSLPQIARCVEYFDKVAAQLSAG